MYYNTSFLSVNIDNYVLVFCLGIWNKTKGKKAQINTVTLAIYSWVKFM